MSTNSQPAAGAKIQVWEIVDTKKIVERGPGELENRRQVSTIHEPLKKHTIKFVDSQKFVDGHPQKPKSGILRNL